MQKSNEKLLETLQHHREELIDRVCNRLQKLSRSRYEVIDYERHREREEEFFDIVVESFQENNTQRLLNHMSDLAVVRANEGYQMEEVQKAIDIFEEELWNVLTTYQPKDAVLVEQLVLCNRIFCEAKNYFSRQYMKKVLQMQQSLSNLKEKFYVYRSDRRELSDQDSY